MSNRKVERVSAEQAPMVWARLSALREKKGWTQAEAAEAINPVRTKLAKHRGDVRGPGTVASDVGRFEGRGKRRTSPPIEYVEAAAVAYGVHLLDLLPPNVLGRRDGGIGYALVRATGATEEEASEQIRIHGRSREQVHATLSVAVGAEGRPDGAKIVDALSALFWKSRPALDGDKAVEAAREWGRHLQVISTPPGPTPPLVELQRLPDDVWQDFWELQILAQRRLLCAALAEMSSFLSRVRDRE